MICRLMSRPESPTTPARWPLRGPSASLTALARTGLSAAFATRRRAAPTILKPPNVRRRSTTLTAVEPISTPYPIVLLSETLEQVLGLGRHVAGRIARDQDLQIAL